MGKTHGRRSRTLPVASARKEFKGEGACCFGWDGLGKVSQASRARTIFAAEPRRVARLSLGRTHSRRSRTLPVASASEMSKGVGTRRFDWDGPGEVSSAAHVRASLANSVYARDFRKARSSRTLPPNLVASHGYRWEGLAFVSAGIISARLISITRFVSDGMISERTSAGRRFSKGRAEVFPTSRRSPAASKGPAAPGGLTSSSNSK